MYGDRLAWTPDRRRSLRIDVPARAGIEAQRAGADLPVTLRQISEGGLVVEGREALGPGTLYDVTLAVTGQPPVQLRGRVIYSRTTPALATDDEVRYVTAVALEADGRPSGEAWRAILAALGHYADVRYDRLGEEDA